MGVEVEVIGRTVVWVALWYVLGYGHKGRKKKIGRVMWGSWETGCLCGKILVLADIRKRDHENEVP